jgi:pimeloyl-ACP methyl ester carboxylesterase
VLAVLDALGLDRVCLMAHDWGAWSGFLACLAAPERFAAFLALGSPRPGGRPSARQLCEVWRLTYQVAIASPVLGRRLVADPRFVERVIIGGAVQRRAWTPDDLRAFTAVLAEPARARASASLYRTFLTREVARTPRQRLRVPARIMLGARDPAIPVVLLDGADVDADHVSVEIVPECGHFVAEEHPARVAQRARELFARR